MSSISRQRKLAKVERWRLRAVAVRTRVRTQVQQARGLMAAQEIEPIKEAVDRATQALDRAASKGIIHPNNAARRKSRLVRQQNRTTPPS
ncbi:MAG: 30S ribosomal protein S20 [Chloroflexota bacterium]